MISSSSTPAKVRDEPVVNQVPVPHCAILSEDKSKASISMPPIPPKANPCHPNGNSPSKSNYGIPIVDSFVLHSDGPAKKCEAKVDVNGFEIPSLAELNRSLGIQSPPNVPNDTPLHADVNSPKEDADSLRDLSPLVPIRLSQYFHNELGDVQCSQYVAGRYLKSFDSPNGEDCIVMVTIPHSDISKSTFSSKPPTVDLCSPAVIKKSTQVGPKVNEAVDDVQIVGSSSFATRCQELSRSNDAVYKKLNYFAAPASSSRNHKK